MCSTTAMFNDAHPPTWHVSQLKQPSQSLKSYCEMLWEGVSFVIVPVCSLSAKSHCWKSTTITAVTFTNWQHIALISLINKCIINLIIIKVNICRLACWFDLAYLTNCYRLHSTHKTRRALTPVTSEAASAYFRHWVIRMTTFLCWEKNSFDLIA